MTPLELYGLILAGSVLVVVALLAGWQRIERGRTPSDGSPEDAAHFARQARRRRAVAVLMVVQSALILVGSRTPHRVDGRPNPWFLVVWLAAFLLVFALLALAFVDWHAIRSYARRQRHEMVREGMEVLKDELRRRNAHPTNGRAADHPDLPRPD